MLGVTRTFAVIGVDAVAVTAEVDVRAGLPGFAVVGLPDAAVREARERVRVAVVNSGFKFPQMRITANLAPADLRKAGPSFDLAIAVALLLADEQLEATGTLRIGLAGELALDGGIRPVNGVLAIAEAARAEHIDLLIVPERNAAEAALVDGLAVAPLRALSEMADLLAGGPPREITPAREPDPALLPDLADLRGQPTLRRGLEIAAAGGHSLVIIGPPGAGKSLGARRLPSILPPLEREEAIEVTRIASAAGRPPLDGRLCGRPFRAPHHTISAAGLVGGGSPPRPGEITLAHHGVLFLDELGEFSRVSLEALRQPLEDGKLTIARARSALTFPARFQLVAAANPCPCGHGADRPECRCREDHARRYEARLSGAVADRIDLTLSIDQPGGDALAGDPGESSHTVRERVIEARLRQGARLGEGMTNSRIEDGELRALGSLDDGAERALAAGHLKLGLSGRGWVRVVRLARTIADLDGKDRVCADNVAEALSLRRRVAP